MDFPYRDLRLVRLFAGMPADLLPPQARDRGLVRAMLADRLPDTIRLRTSGMAAEPDHDQRLQRQAPAARARIAAFRKAELDEWLDLDWLDRSLARVAEHGAEDAVDANEVQVTAMVAEFLTWWRARS
jgi:asparagine synthase (glutamine-hydrolysing)